MVDTSRLTGHSEVSGLISGDTLVLWVRWSPAPVTSTWLRLVLGWKGVEVVS